MAMRKKTARAMKEARLAQQEKALLAKGMNPTVSETQEEIDYLQNLLDDHGCDTTRMLICRAALVVDIAHKVAHGEAATDEASNQIDTFVDEVAGYAKGIATNREMSRRISQVLFGLAAFMARQAMSEDQLATMPCDEVVN